VTARIGDRYFFMASPAAVFSQEKEGKGGGVEKARTRPSVVPVRPLFPGNGAWGKKGKEKKGGGREQSEAPVPLVLDYCFCFRGWPRGGQAGEGGKKGEKRQESEPKNLVIATQSLSPYYHSPKSPTLQGKGEESGRLGKKGEKKLGPFRSVATRVSV